jgi:hypothetical protein
MRVISALLALTASPWISIAAAQTSAPPLDLNGIWELHDYGDRLSTATPLVEIAHSGSSVTASFIRASECYNGIARTTAFQGRLTGLQPAVPMAQLSAQNMSVCSNDKALVQKCSGSITAIYNTSIAFATAENDFIQGARVTQGVTGCTPDASENGTARFWLRRLTPCEYEQRVLKDAEAELLELFKSITEAKPVFRAAIDAAKQRFPETYRNQPIAVLDYPHRVVDLSDDAVHAEALFSAMPDLFRSPEWIDAARMAIALGQENPPLVEGWRMLDEMTRIERTTPEAQRLLNQFKGARDAERKCRTP